MHHNRLVTKAVLDYKQKWHLMFDIIFITGKDEEFPGRCPMAKLVEETKTHLIVHTLYQEHCPYGTLQKIYSRTLLFVHEKIHIALTDPTKLMEPLSRWQSSPM